MADSCHQSTHFEAYNCSTGLWSEQASWRLWRVLFPAQPDSWEPRLWSSCTDWGTKLTVRRSHTDTRSRTACAVPRVNIRLASECEQTCQCVRLRHTNVRFLRASACCNNCAGSCFRRASPAGGFGGFGATTAAPQAAATPASGFSFGQTSTPAQGLNLAQPASGATTGLSFGSSFGKPATTQAATGLGFSAPQATQASTLSYGATPAATQATGLSFGTPSTQGTGLSFGTTPASTQATGLSFGTAPASTGTALSFGTTTATTQATGLSFGTTPASTQGTGLSFGVTPAPQATPSTGLNFGAPASTGTGLSFGTTPASSAGLSFGTSTAQTTASLGFGATSSAATTAGLSFGTTSTAATTAATGLSFGTATSGALNFGKTPASTATTTAASGFQLGKPATTSAGGFSLTSTASSQPSSTASTTAPSSITALGKTTAATTMPYLFSLSPKNWTTAAAPPQPITSITFAQLEENINKWTLELEEQEKTFINQATQINAWDRLLIANGEKIVEVNDTVQAVKNEQQSLELELDFVLAQQKELEDLLAPLEKQLLESGDRARDPEREQMYNLAENLDSQLKTMSQDLKEVIEHLNETNRSQDSNDPIGQIGRILNAHMSSMQWIDNSIAQISTKLDQLKATHDTLRRDNERSFHLAYN
ncbi:nuclear pore glycoprotein p62 [Leguminivora glycinivorella]|uniref:nuclear pore glycoprotein p62 n=1 Tax=Leguminivora glycinivorella TaxID=1035111 RepID=UPI0020107407|nr:nuclear pore glycoprotein p62 [Leguminivora glycinivorella]